MKPVPTRSIVISGSFHKCPLSPAITPKNGVSCTAIRGLAIWSSTFSDLCSYAYEAQTVVVVPDGTVDIAVLSRRPYIEISFSNFYTSSLNLNPSRLYPNPACKLLPLTWRPSFIVNENDWLLYRPHDQKPITSLKAYFGGTHASGSKWYLKLRPLLACARYSWRIDEAGNWRRCIVFKGTRAFS